MPIKIDHKKDLLKEYKKFKLFFYVYKPADLKKIFNTMKDYKIIYMLFIFVILAFASIYYMDRYLDDIRTTTEMEKGK